MYFFKTWNIYHFLKVIVIYIYMVKYSYINRYFINMNIYISVFCPQVYPGFNYQHSSQEIVCLEAMGTASKMILEAKSCMTAIQYGGYAFKYVIYIIYICLDIMFFFHC